MQLDGRRESTNVDDRRTSGGAVAGGLGIAGVVIAGLIYLLTGQQVDPSQFDMGQTTQTNVEFTQEEQELASFAKKILAGTEDIWTAYFSQAGLGTYVTPTMVLYTGTTRSGCGTGSASMGPFYCSADQCLYLDLSFFSSMKIAFSLVLSSFALSHTKSRATNIPTVRRSPVSSDISKTV